MIESILKEKNITPKAFKVGGNKGYEVILDCKTGVVYYRIFGEDYLEV